MKGKLILEDGSVFSGELLNNIKATGEVVFNTIKDCETGILNRIVFEIPEQIIYNRVYWSMYPSLTGFGKHRCSVECIRYSMNKIK